MGGAASGEAAWKTGPLTASWLLCLILCVVQATLPQAWGLVPLSWLGACCALSTCIRCRSFPSRASPGPAPQWTHCVGAGRRKADATVTNRPTSLSFQWALEWPLPRVHPSVPLSSRSGLCLSVCSQIPKNGRIRTWRQNLHSSSVHRFCRFAQWLAALHPASSSDLDLTFDV